MDIAGCVWPTSLHICSASWPLRKSAPTSASADDLITFFFMFDNLCTLLFDSLYFLIFWYPMKKCTPALLRALSYDKYDELLCIISIIYLA